MVEKMYRYESDYWYTGDGFMPDKLILREMNVISYTPKGKWIERWYDRSRKQFVLNGSHKRYAHETPNLALESYISRRNKQINILNHQLEIAKAELEIAKKLNNELSPA